MLKIIEKTKIWFTISILIIAIGLGFLFTKGLNWGIDFKGGTLVVINMGSTSFEKTDIEDIFSKQASDISANLVGETNIEIRSNSLNNEKVSIAFKEVKEKYSVDDTALVSQEEIGASVGKELTNKAIIALLVANAAILVYIAIRFEFTFGIAAIIALVHDLLITLSVYAIFGVPVNTPFIAAVLTITGYSINDTIVIFDRIRENLKLQKIYGYDIKEVANKSITETMTRSIYTVLTTVIAITAVYVFVPSVRDFAFPITIGILSGAFSSVFIASPVWVMIKNNKKLA